MTSARLARSSTGLDFSGRKFHFIGIGGAGMSGLAAVAKELGGAVTGSDRAESSYTDRLKAAGVAIAIGHDQNNLPDAADVVVSTAIDEKNPELAAARKLGLTVLHRSDLLAELAEQKCCIAVAGTHGKTTTTAMIAHILGAIGLQPSFFVGGEIEFQGQTTNSLWSEGETVVVEADESDRSFLKLSPAVAVVTNLELDHHSTYGGLPDLEAAFAEFLARADTAVLWRDQPLVRLAPAKSNIFSFAIDGAAERQPVPTGTSAAAESCIAVNVAHHGTGSSFTLRHRAGEIEVALAVPGAHNVLNALAAIAACVASGVDPAAAATALKDFGGVGRRFEARGTAASGATVFDDYAHHPTEVEATLRAARSLAAERSVGARVVAVFQPHLFSRTASLAREFGRALALADVVIVLDIYAARELQDDFPGVDGRIVAAAAADAAPGRAVVWAPAHDDAFRYLDAQLGSEDICLTIGAGDVFELADRLVKT